MVLVPLKWLPAILLIGGICFLLSGESPGWGIILAVVGGIWSCAWYLPSKE